MLIDLFLTLTMFTFSLDTLFGESSTDVHPSSRSEIGHFSQRAERAQIQVPQNGHPSSTADPSLIHEPNHHQNLHSVVKHHSEPAVITDQSDDVETATSHVDVSRTKNMWEQIGSASSTPCGTPEGRRSPSGTPSHHQGSHQGKPPVAKKPSLTRHTESPLIMTSSTQNTPRILDQEGDVGLGTGEGV